MAVCECGKEEVQVFDYGAIEMQDGAFKRSFAECYRYYMGISVDDMLYELRKKFKIANAEGAKTLAGEKGSWFGLGGNVLGQWLQAYARFYAVTGEEAAKDKADAMIAGFKQIMEIDSEIGDGLFMYFFEKYLRGFVDCFVYCKNEDALVLADRFVDAAMRSPVYCNAKRRLGDNGTPPVPVEIEWYTIAESLYFYADVKQAYGKDGERAEKVRKFAKEFEYRQFWDIVYRGENIFNYSPISGQNTAYFHSYSHLNSFNSAAYAYKDTQDPYYLEIVKKFYAYMREKQELITGGYGAHLEWLMPITGQINAIENFHDSFETQCCSYAVYRLSEWLVEFTGEGGYGNWPEKLLYNATLASIPMDEAGHVQYYSDLNVGHACKFLHENTWTCCTGTRPLLMCELSRFVYLHSETGLYVNLFVPSAVEYGGLRVRMESEYPREQTVFLHIEASDGREREIYFRIPEHAKRVQLAINGKAASYIRQNGWLGVRGVFREGDVLQYTAESVPEWDRLECMGEGVVGLRCGAVVLATESPVEEVKGCLNFEEEAAPQLIRTEGLTFRAKSGKVVFSPYMDYPKGKNYHVYFRYGRGC